MYKLGNRSRKRLEGVHPKLIKLIEYSLEHEDCPHDFGIPSDGGLRTDERQAELYSKGRRGMKGEKKVTNADGVRNKSRHQKKLDGYGYAFDIYVYENGSANWDRQKLTEIANHIFTCADKLGIKIQWGGYFKSFKDLPHFQLAY